MNAGLDGVIAAETALSEVDGIQGRLIVRGLTVEELAARHDYAETAALLWHDLAPTTESPEAIAAALGQARLQAAALVPALLPAARQLSPVEGLRAGLALLADDNPAGDHIAVTAAIPVFVAALWRAQQGAAAIAPDPARGQVEDFLAMLHGGEVDAGQCRALEAYLVTVADHGMNASTFTARVVASTHAGVVSSVVAALCALKGPLHGGAPGPVLDMLDEIGDEARIQAWIAAQLDGGARLMGFGHRIYRTRDPRADVLKELVAGLRGGANRIAFAERVEQAAKAALAQRHPDRPLDTNVEFYTALLLEAVGLPRPLFTPAFAMGRVLGWTAHVFEQLAAGRIIRPASRYTGPLPAGARRAARAG